LPSGSPLHPFGLFLRTMASEAAGYVPMDRDLFLRLRSLVVADAAEEKPVLGLCQAEAYEMPPEPEAKEPEKKRKKDKKDKRAEKEGALGDAPWRKDRGSPQEGVRSPNMDSPSLTPAPSPGEQTRSLKNEGAPPWRKSPEGSAQASPASPNVDLAKIPSPCASDRDPGASDAGDGGQGGGSFQMLLSEQTEDTKGKAAKSSNADASESFLRLPDQLASMEQKDGDEAESERPEGDEEGSGDKTEWWKNKAEWKDRDSKWKVSSKEEGGVPLPSELTVSANPPPPLTALAGTWFDSLGNMVQVPLYPAVAWFTGTAGTSQHELTLDKWGRLWCGNGVLHQVGYSAGPLSQDMPPSHLSWRTTAWKFSIWERIAAAPEAPGPPAGKGEKKERKKGGGKEGGKGKKGRDADGKGGKGKGKDERGEAAAAAPKPPEQRAPPTLGDFLSFPSLGDKAEKKKAKEKPEKKPSE